MIASPCKNCKDQQLGCHSSCEKYLKYRQDLEEAKQQKLIATKGECLLNQHKQQNFKRDNRGKIVWRSK